MLAAPTALLWCLALCAPTAGGLGSADVTAAFALRCGKVVTCDAEDRVWTPGVVVVREGRIAAIGGADLVVPDDVTVIERPHHWLVPGMIDLHTHIHSGGWGDLNDMVRTINPDLRAGSALRPSNALIRRACASGVTTLFGIPGSGTSISGFGVLYKSKTDATYEEVVFADPGGMKVAQTNNPERSAGDLGATRAGLSWALESINRRAKAVTAQGRSDWQLDDLAGVHARLLPVLMHCAGSDGVANAARMWGKTFPTRSVISHGSFDGWHVAEFVAELGIPVNHGPRTMNWSYGYVEERIVGTAAAYVDAGVPLFSLNTDSPVIPQEELFLQGSMSARLGADAYQMLRAVTIHPAQAFAIDGRLGSLEVGKDADLVLRLGDPLDPRAAVEAVWIEGHLEYDRARDGQWF